MIYVTGDTHGDFHRFSTDIFPEQKEMTKDDYVIICGDFGGVWYPEDSKYIKEENYWLNWLDDKPFTTLFVDGNHENADRLYKFPVKDWHGGKVHEIRPSVLHLMRGEIFEIDGVSIFAFGGASSHDIDDGIVDRADYSSDKAFREDIKKMQRDGRMFRINHISWWEQELPSQEEMDNGIRNLEKHNYEVDFVITHCAPQSITSLISFGIYKPDKLTKYFDELLDRGLKFKKFLCGHLHLNQNVMCDYIILYEQIIRIN